MSNNEDVYMDKIEVINNFEGAVKLLGETEKKLRWKAKETEWLRFAFRRMPLYSGAGLIFFSICFALVMIKEIGFEKIDCFLDQVSSFYQSWFVFGFLVSIVMLFFLFMFNAERELKLDLSAKLITNAILWAISFFGFSLIVSSEYRLEIGLTFYSVITLISLVADRVLGFTRRNVRYEFYASKAETLKIVFKSEATFPLRKFSIRHLRELQKFHDEVAYSKYTDAINDTQYVIKQLEELKGKK